MNSAGENHQTGHPWDERRWSLFSLVQVADFVKLEVLFLMESPASSILCESCESCTIRSSTADPGVYQQANPWLEL
jgi:hypothetical protein